MKRYDIYGNLVENSSENNLSTIIKDVKISGKIVNLVNPSEITVGTESNSAYTNRRTTGFTPVEESETYVAQFISTKGNDGYDYLVLYDSERNELGRVGTARYSDLGVRCAICEMKSRGYVRFVYDYTDGNEKPMIFAGHNPTSEYVEYGQNTDEDWKYDKKSSTLLETIVRRDIEPSNIYKKKVCMIGDSNADNWAAGIAEQLEKRYGCTVKGYGRYGATWGSSVGISDTSYANAIGQYNALVADNPIDAETKLFPGDCVFLFMMGTNTASEGVGTVSDAGVNTDLGAANYILKRMRYYGRANAIGVFLPWACNAEKRNGMIAICETYKIPYFDIPAIICDNQPTSELASDNHITDGGNHLSVHGWKTFARIAHPWIAYQI